MNFQRTTPVTTQILHDTIRQKDRLIDTLGATIRGLERQLWEKDNALRQGIEDSRALYKVCEEYMQELEKVIVSLDEQFLITCNYEFKYKAEATQQHIARIAAQINKIKERLTIH